MEHDDHGEEGHLLRSVSPGMFLDQPEDLLETSTVSTSVDFDQGRLPSHSDGEIGDSHDPVVVDGGEQGGENAAKSQDYNNSSSSSHASEEGDTDGEDPDESSEADGAEDVDIQEPVQEAQEADQEDPGDGSDNDSTTDVAEDPMNDDAADAQDEVAVMPLIRLIQTGSNNCHGCDVLKRRIQSLIQQKENLQYDIEALKEKISDLERKNENKRRVAASNPAPIPAGPQSRRAEKTWQRLIRQSTVGPNPSSTTPWYKIMRVCAREENYPLKQLHPHIQLVSESSSREPLPITPRADIPRGPFKQAFPDEILLQIFREILVFDGQLVFVFSRLDPFVPLESLPESSSERSSGLKGRLYISGAAHSTISLTHDTISPGPLLTLLLVCRKWNFYGVHLFYGDNTFAFSSFGEFDRFCNGIGTARVQRLAHLELHWMGGQSLRWVDENKQSDRIDRRVAPLAWLCEMSRLTTLCIFIDESSRQVIRRPNEPQGFKEYMKKITAGQPNARMYRDIRASRGMDAVYQLRGLQYVHLYDTTKMVATRDRSKSAVRDQSAVIDINRTATMAKTPARGLAARLRRLDPLFKPIPDKWTPGNKGYHLVQQVYAQSKHSNIRINDLDIDCPGQKTPSTTSDASDNEDDSDGSEDSSSDASSTSSDSGSPRRARGLPTPTSPAGEEPCTRRGPTPAPTSGKELSDSSEEEEEPSEAEADNIDGKVEDEENRSDGAGTASEPEDLVRRQRTDEFLQSLIQVEDYDGLMGEPLSGTNRPFRRARSQGAASNVSHVSGPLQNIWDRFSNLQAPILIDESDDEDCKIISRPATGAFSQERPQSRSQPARRSMSDLFCTPGPDERSSVTRTNENTTASPSPGPSLSAPASAHSRASSAHIDLTLDDDSDEDLGNDVPARQAGPSPSPSQQQQHLAQRGTRDPPQSSPLREVGPVKDEGEGPGLAAAAGLLDVPSGGRGTMSCSPRPRGVKRTRVESSVAATEPDESTEKKRQRTFDFGSLVAGWNSQDD